MNALRERMRRPEPRVGARRGFDVLGVPGVGAFLKSRHGRQSLQGLSLLIAAGLIVDGLFGHQMGSMNLAVIVPWTYGRGLFVLGLLAFGNLFCLSCPFMLPREAAKWLMRKLGVRQAVWPRVLRNKWLPAVLVVGFFWAYEALDLWNSPLRTAVMLLAYFATAFAVDAVYRDASFCKYVCPLGQFNFTTSLLSPVEVAPRSLSTCSSCATRDCIAGHAAVPELARPYQRGCELHLFQPSKEGNMDCTLCMDCVKACPHDNIGLFAHAPAAGLVQLSTVDPQRSGVGRYRQRMDLALLALTVVAASFASAAVMVAPVVGWLDWAGARLLPAAQLPASFLLAASIPAVLFGLLVVATRSVGGFARLPLWALALLPLGGGMWMAHLSFHLVTAWDSVWPGFLQAAHELTRAGLPLKGLPQPDWMMERPLMNAASVLGLQFVLLERWPAGSALLRMAADRWQGKDCGGVDGSSGTDDAALGQA